MSTFKAYLIAPASGPREYETSLDRAKARARETSGTFEAVQLPALKSGLIPFLNKLEAEAAVPPAEAPVAPPAPAAPVPALARVAWSSGPAPAPGNPDALIDWVFDVATPSQIADIFNGLGARFAESIRERRLA